MSNNTQTINTGQQATTNYDLSKMFILNNRYENANYTNGGGSPVTLPAGTLMGRITSSQLVIPHVSTAVDGSQNPIGILASDYVVAAGATQQLSLCMKGDVVDSLIILGGSDTMNTAIGTKIIRDILNGLGFNLISSTEMTQYDN